MIKKCEYCNQEFKCRGSRTRFCGRSCSGKVSGFQKGGASINKGVLKTHNKVCVSCGKYFVVHGEKKARIKCCSEECKRARTDIGRFKKGNYPTNAGNPQSYGYVHKLKNRTKKECCDFCEVENVDYHWASNGHLYEKDDRQWFYLCIPCHRKFDAQMRRIKVVDFTR